LATVGIDPDAELISRLQRGDLPVQEPGLAALLEQSQDEIMFTDDLSALTDCPLVIVSKDVPTDAANVSNLDAVWRLIESAVPHLRQDVVLVVMSQVPPGFTRSVGDYIRRARPELSFELLYWVETLIFGDAVRRTLHPERFIVGCADANQALPAIFVDGLERYGCPILHMSYVSAELTKTAINLYLVGSVTYANTLADLCETVGADWAEMVPALQLDRRIGPAAYLRPSLGVAGGNLERDLMTLQALCRAGGVDATYVDALIDYNTRRFDWLWRQLGQRVLGRSPLPCVAIWGLAYKKNTRSTKNSTALRLIAGLNGKARLRAWDPAVRRADLAGGVDVGESRDAVLKGAHCLVIMTDWDDFAAADLDRVRADLGEPLVIDAVGVLEHRRHEMFGIDYVSMGRRT
jgi:UDPglucose 6-dehydrogenase